MSASGRTSTSNQSTDPSVPRPSPRRASSVCIPKGKWYDCLRPTEHPYQGFGSIANFANMSGKGTQTDAGEAWTRDIYGKMKSFNAHDV
ncbi:uncharacterized protein Z518_04708 [Rhinocladiella mackenziei CBS 650.93]|uniref:Uncharacterized protein n=1 Tax=Rhinocladiella mackenziei CBS 650.93 TaxID=1442369 RepID=A0A0D2FWS7_9EURO|nr:uncharacterized protein Z518_04708 [Rhinocladiella mackenziei CBS 650.93]KIX06732.1 hypothetical protein Z518_04708 [Rhinocladiella mackenziei CBS 650.93]